MGLGLGAVPWFLAVICSGCTAETSPCITQGSILTAASSDRECWGKISSQDEKDEIHCKFLQCYVSMLYAVGKNNNFCYVFWVQTWCVEVVFTPRWRQICHQVPSQWKAIPKQRNEKGRCQWLYFSPQQREDKHTVPRTNQMLETDRLGQSRHKAYLCPREP